MKPSRILALTAIAPLLGCSGASLTPLAGQYMPDCAPWDGAAFAVEVPYSDAGGTFWLRGYASLDNAAGTWPHAKQGGPGEGHIALCRKSGQTDCSYPQSGQFTISGRAGGPLQGTLEASFPDGKRYQFAFTATPQPPPRHPVLCG